MRCTLPSANLSCPDPEYPPQQTAQETPSIKAAQQGKPSQYLLGTPAAPQWHCLVFLRPGCLAQDVGAFLG